MSSGLCLIFRIARRVSAGEFVEYGRFSLGPSTAGIEMSPQGRALFSSAFRSRPTQRRRIACRIRSRSNKFLSGIITRYYIDRADFLRAMNEYSVHHIILPGLPASIKQLRLSKKICSVLANPDRTGIYTCTYTLFVTHAIFSSLFYLNNVKTRYLFRVPNLAVVLDFYNAGVLFYPYFTDRVQAPGQHIEEKARSR
ncbi:hypothetical protein F4861DRAFT_146327 [Xylaria intraflava]|nr:hypothetical protein F4861DRAFT_146327 [Xylaria intraflava]